MNKIKFILLTAGIVLATAFTFSCSSDDGEEGGGGDSSSSGGDLSSSGGGGGSSSSNNSGCLNTGNGTFTDIRDGKNYKYVTICSQIWMAENLNYNAIGSECNGEDPVNCTEYGKLYDWNTAISACPDGWKLPSDAEWTILIDYVGGDSIAGGKLKSTSGWIENGNGTDNYGFSALPGGDGYIGGGTSNAGDYGVWWSSTEHDAENVWFRGMNYSHDVARRQYYFKTYMYSVRCLKGDGGGVPSSSSGNDSSFTDSRDGTIYKKAKIGNQTWMANNLNYNATGSKCYGNDPDNCAKYGRLYDWSTANTVCPSGWSLPNDDQWTMLTDFAGGKSVAGVKLKSTSGWNENGNGTDDYGFSALPGGDSGDGESFANAGDYGVWWSSTVYDDSYAWYWGMNHNYESVRNNYYLKSYLYSVRCVEDN